MKCAAGALDRVIDAYVQVPPPPPPPPPSARVEIMGSLVTRTD
jgi:hypothetical protein